MILQFAFSLITTIILLLVLIITSLPLYFSVKLLGGKTTLFIAMMVNLASGVLFFLISKTLPYGMIIGFVVLLFVYGLSFRLGWIRALLVWLMQSVLLFIFVVVLTLIKMVRIV